MKTFGERLRHLRGSQSQAALAAKLGIPQMTLGNYERDRNEPKFAVIDKICSLFEVSPEWLLFGRGPLRPTEREEAEASARAVVPPSAAACPRCVRLENELEQEREERRRVNDALIEAMTKNLSLTEENGRLRLENLQRAQEMKNAVFRSGADRDERAAANGGLFPEGGNIPSSEERIKEEAAPGVIRPDY